MPPTFIRPGSATTPSTASIGRTNSRRAVAEAVTTPHGDAADGPSRFDRWRPAVAFAVVVLVASVVPIPGSTSAASPGAGLGFTAAFHVVGYAVLAALIACVIGRSLVGLASAAVLATAFGFGIEVLQSPIPWRSFAWLDVLFNALGAVVGVTAVAVAIARRVGESGE